MILLYLDMFTKETRRLFLYEYREITSRVLQSHSSDVSLHIQSKCDNLPWRLFGLLSQWTSTFYHHHHRSYPRQVARKASATLFYSFWLSCTSKDTSQLFISITMWFKLNWVTFWGLLTPFFERMCNSAKAVVETVACVRHRFLHILPGKGLCEKPPKPLLLLWRLPL